MSENSKDKPLFFSLGVHPKVHALTEPTEINGFKQKAEQEEKIQNRRMNG